MSRQETTVSETLPAEAESAIDALLRPRSIAVLGASSRPGPGRNVVRNLIELGFAGEMYLVNPRKPTIDGRPSYGSLAALPEVPELVVAAVNRDATVQAVSEAAELGCRAVVLLAAGFGEADAHGSALEARLRAVASHMALMGPNCLGFVNLEDNVAAYSGPLMEPPACGSVALVSQSGAMACTLTGAAAERRIRFSHVITTGNQLDLTTESYVRWLLHRPAVGVIACYLEGFRDGRGLLEALSAAREAGKVVVVLKAGRSVIGGEAALSHTGALAGSAPIQEEAFRQSGVLVASDPEELLALVELGARLGHRRRPLAVGAVTISGGERLLIADGMEDAGIPLARLSEETMVSLREVLPKYAVVANPLDTTGAGIVEGETTIHDEAVRLVALEPSVELLLACQDTKNGWVEGRGESGLFRRGVVAAQRAAAASGKPLVVISPTAGEVDAEAREFLDRNSVPCLTGLATGISALGKFMRSEVSSPAPLPTWPQVAAPSESSGISGYEALRRLQQNDIPIWPTRIVTSEQEALAASAELGYPVALKIDGSNVRHRTELGGVYLGVHDGPAVTRAWMEIMRRAESASVERPAVLVQSMAPAGVELFVGGFRDVQFGPVLLFGVGGTLVDLLGRPISALAPFELDQARRLIDREPFRRLLSGWRGYGAVDLDALAEAIVRLSRFVAKPDVAVLDVNPLLALPDRVAVIDAKLVLQGHDRNAAGRQ